MTGSINLDPVTRLRRLEQYPGLHSEHPIAPWLGVHFLRGTSLDMAIEPRAWDGLHKQTLEIAEWILLRCTLRTRYVEAFRTVPSAWLSPLHIAPYTVPLMALR